MSETIGGFDFFGENDKIPIDEPRFVDHGGVTSDVFFDPDARLLELNSKSGVYPLYLAYSFYRIHCDILHEGELNREARDKIWEKVLRDNIFVLCQTKMAEKITHRVLAGYKDFRTNCKTYPGLVDILKTGSDEDKKQVVRTLNSKQYWLNGNNKETMDFKAIVGNPPYQKKLSDTSPYSTSIYQFFVDLAWDLGPEHFSLITPSRWMTKDGQGIKDEWVDKMINCNHFVKIVDYPDASDCFSGVEIKGGVYYFLFSPQYEGDCEHIIRFKGQTVVKNGQLNASGMGIILRDEYAQGVLEKIVAVEGPLSSNNTFSSLVGARDFFTKKVNGVSILGTNWTGYVLKKDSEHPIKLYFNKDLSSASGVGWISKTDVPKNEKAIAYHKVFMPNAGGSGNDQLVLGQPFYGEPDSVCSVTYLVIGPDGQITSKRIAQNIIAYIQTKFFRYLVSIKKRTQHTSKDVFQFVPLQDFTRKWTDSELYAKYNLTQTEIDYIESRINPMR